MPTTTLRPHLRRTYLGSTLGWRWGIYLNPQATLPVVSVAGFPSACLIAKGIFNRGGFQ